MTVKTKIRIGPLATTGNCKTEIARVIAQARRGDLDVNDATKFVYMMKVLVTVIETTDVERRLDALEAINQPVPLRRIA